MENKLHVYGKFQKIAWNSTFYGNHARKGRKAQEKKEYICVLFMDLSKAFDTTKDNLLLEKLLIYGFCMNAPNLICSYVILKMENRERKLTTTLVLQNRLLLGFGQAQ